MNRTISRKGYRINRTISRINRAVSVGQYLGKGIEQDFHAWFRKKLCLFNKGRCQTSLQLGCAVTVCSGETHLLLNPVTWKWHYSWDTSGGLTAWVGEALRSGEAWPHLSLVTKYLLQLLPYCMFNMSDNFAHLAISDLLRLVGDFFSARYREQMVVIESDPPPWSQSKKQLPHFWRRRDPYCEKSESKPKGQKLNQNSCLHIQNHFIPP